VCSEYYITDFAQNSLRYNGVSDEEDEAVCQNKLLQQMFKGLTSTVHFFRFVVPVLMKLLYTDLT
jgi:hypothetical protein